MTLTIRPKEGEVPIRGEGKIAALRRRSKVRCSTGVVSSADHAARKMGVSHPKGASLLDLLPQLLLDFREVREALVEALDQALHLVLRHVGVLERIAQRGGGVVQVVGALGELARR